MIGRIMVVLYFFSNVFFLISFLVCRDVQSLKHLNTCRYSLKVCKLSKSSHSAPPAKLRVLKVAHVGRPMCHHSAMPLKAGDRRVSPPKGGSNSKIGISEYPGADFAGEQYDFSGV